jgi:hypothetical protein
MSPRRHAQAAKGRCAFCGEEVQAYNQAAYPVRGWEIERQQGGANHILLRQRVPNIIAHAFCVQRAAKQAQGTGPMPGQMDLLGPEAS